MESVKERVGRWKEEEGKIGEEEEEMKILNPLIKLITWRLAGNELKEWPSVSLPLL